MRQSHAYSLAASLINVARYAQSSPFSWSHCKSMIASTAGLRARPRVPVLTRWRECDLPSSSRYKGYGDCTTAEWLRSLKMPRPVLVDSILSRASLWMQLGREVCKLAMVLDMTNKAQIVHTLRSVQCGQCFLNLPSYTTYLIKANYKMVWTNYDLVVWTWDFIVNILVQGKQQ